MIRKALLILVVTLLGALAFGQPTGYADTPVRINCGILLLPGTSGPGGEPTNADPYVFFNLERRSDLKPPAWEFVNPLAPGSVTPAIAQRWANITGGAPYQVGEPLLKNMAAYWEVDLGAVGVDQISRYDILLVHAPGTLNLNAFEREKLRVFLDKGGVLWFDKSTVQLIDGYNGFPIAFTTTNAGAFPVVTRPFHPILNYPYRISPFEAAFIGAHNGTHAITRATLAAAGLGGFDRLVSTMEGEFDLFMPVAVNNAGITIGVAEVGQGYFVVTSGNIVSPINEPAGGVNVGLGRNSGPFGGTDFQAIPQLELKFAYNILALATNSPNEARGSRRTNATFDELGAPLMLSWLEDYDLEQNEHSDFVPPIIFRGISYFVAREHNDNQWRLFAIKVDPAQDLDNDGWLDDGFQDASLGATRDLVWRSQPFPSRTGPPMAIEVANPVGGAPENQVYVQTEQGDVYVFDALPMTNGRLVGNINMTPVRIISPNPAADFQPGVEHRGPYAPVAFDGLVYIFDSYRLGLGYAGRVWAIDPTSLSIVNTGSDWYARGNGAPNLPSPSGPPTVGYIPSGDNPTGLDGVMYVPHRSSLGGPSVGFSSVWVSVRGESPEIVSNDGTVMQIRTRAALKGLRVVDASNSILGLKLTLIDANGNPQPPASLTNFFDGTVIQFAPGQLSLGLRNGGPPPNWSLRVDYHIDWGSGAPNLISQLIRGQIFLPDDINREAFVVKSMALAANGNLFVVAGNEQRGGALFCFNEFTRGGFRLVYRWDLYDSFNVTLNNTQVVRIPAVLEDRDFINTIFPFLNGTLSRFHFHGGPTIINDVCYITVAADKFIFGTRVPVAFIVALDANPRRTDIRLTAPAPPGLRIRQPDYMASGNKLTPERSNVLQGQQYENIGGTVLRISNMMSSTQGQVQNGFSTSLPIVISGQGTGETLFDPNTTGSKWSPLLWYIALTGYRVEGPALVMGNTVYMAAGSNLPEILRTGNPTVFEGVMFAMDAEIPPNDPSLITIPNRPGLKQVSWLLPSAGPPGFTTNKHVRWPSGQGVQSIQDFRVRLEQTVMPGADQAFGAVGGNGTLVAWADHGIFGFRRGLTAIADEGRVAEFDASGFARWTSDVAYQVAQNGGNTLVQTRKLERPTKVYKISQTEYAVVDTGGDRVVRIDRSAGEVRTIERILLDGTYRPSGWTEGDPLELRQPRDVTMWIDVVRPGTYNLSSPPITQNELWVHYLIADTGNRRIIELVDRYLIDANFRVTGVVRDAQGVPQLGVLIWHTPSSFSGKTWQFTTIQRILIGVDTNGNNKFVYVAGVGDMMPSRVDLGLDPPDPIAPRETGNLGGLVIFSSSGTEVVNEIVVPGFYAGTRKIRGVNSVFLRGIGLDANGEIDFSILFTDSTGVYEIARNASGQWEVIWMMPNEVYRAMRGVDLRAAAATRTMIGDIVITNSWFGQDPNGNPFFGEVTQWRTNIDFSRQDLGFSNLNVQMEIPPVVGTRGIRLPQYADRK